MDDGVLIFCNLKSSMMRPVRVWKERS